MYSSDPVNFLSPSIRLAFSPCPNDTFIFYGMVHHKIDTEGIHFEFSMSDVEELNRMALKREADMIKVSIHTWLFVKSDYRLLDSGSALGRGNGPLIIARQHLDLDDLNDRLIAIPGEMTTAHLLLRYAVPRASRKVALIFNRIEDAVLNYQVDAGVIIHENRFTYEKKGLIKVCDLGEYWEKSTGLPIPLGGILAKKSLGIDLVEKLNRIMKRSVEYGLQHPEEAMDFVKENAQEMEEEVMKKHIALYVNPFTVDLGEEGKNAIRRLEDIL